MCSRKLLQCTIVLGILLPFLCGCGGGGDGPERAAVRGTIWVDGRPLKNGSIKFVPTGATQGPEAAAEVKDGAYELSSENGPIVGTVRVEIRDAVDPGFDLDDPQAFTRHGNKPLPGPKIPTRYNQRSTLTRTVHAGESNEFDFKIETSEKQRLRR